MQNFLQFDSLIFELHLQQNGFLTRTDSRKHRHFLKNVESYLGHPKTNKSVKMASLHLFTKKVEKTIYFIIIVNIKKHGSSPFVN